MLSCFNAGQAVITSIDFASFGNPQADVCGAFSLSACHANSSLAAVSSRCVGKKTCEVEASVATFGDPCPDLLKTLAVEFSCGYR